MVENLPANADAREAGSIPGSGRSPGRGNGSPLQYSCLKNRTDRGAWWTIFHAVAKSWTQLSTHAHKLESRSWLSPVPSALLRGWREGYHQFFLTAKRIHTSLTASDPWLPMPQWMDQGSAKPRSCSDLVSFSALRVHHSGKLPFHSAEPHPHWGPELESRGWNGLQMLLLKGLWGVEAVVLEWKMWRKERFSQQPYIMELLQAEKSEKQMAMNRQMHHGDNAWVGGREAAAARWQQQKEGESPPCGTHIRQVRVGGRRQDHATRD